MHSYTLYSIPSRLNNNFFVNTRQVILILAMGAALIAGVKGIFRVVNIIYTASFFHLGGLNQ